MEYPITTEYKEQMAVAAAKEAAKVRKPRKKKLKK